jgi:ABC-type sugar transport system ATPase subunit
LSSNAQGVTSIIISHKLNEVRSVADRVTVIRDGATISTLNANSDEITEDRIVRDMVGRDMAQRFPERKSDPGEMLMEVRDWNVWHPEHKERQVIRNASLNVRRGEVVGIAGLMGSGRTELAMSIFGKSYGRRIRAKSGCDGAAVDVSTVDRSISAGLAYVTEDRKTSRACSRRDHPAKHHARQPSRKSRRSASSRKRRKRQCRRELPQGDQYPHARCVSEGRQPVGRQPAEGGAVQMAVRQSRRC